MKQKESRIFQNATMLFLMSIAKLIFPFLTLPYLTRVLSVDGYATVAYVKSVMQYLQLLVDFGFMLSATKAIANLVEDRAAVSGIVSNTILAKLILSAIGLIVLVPIMLGIPLVRQNILYTFLSYIVVVLSSFQVDYLFRGLEQMQEITIRFVVMKGISTILTFFVVHSDADLLLIPILDIISSVIALILIWRRTKVYSIRLIWPKLSVAVEYLKESFQYFISDIATTAFGALNTLLIGVFLPAAQVALWTVALQVISAVQVMYSPIINSIYPEMVKYKSKKLLKKICCIFMPLILCGSALLYMLSGLAITIVAGEKYLDAIPVLRMLIPVLIWSFPGMLFGWTALGAIGKVKETSMTTVVSAIVQCAGLCLLIIMDGFTLLAIAAMRGITEFVLFALRFGFCVRFRERFQ